MPFAARPMVGQRHFHRCISRLRARVAKQHLVQIAWAHGRNHFGGFVGLVICSIERRGVIQRVELIFDRLVDRFAVVPRAHAPQARDAIDHLAPIVRGEMHATGRHHDARRFVEATVGGKGQPEVVGRKIVVGHENLQ